MRLATSLLTKPGFYFSGAKCGWARCGGERSPSLSRPASASPGPHFLAPVQNYKNHQIPFPLPRNVMSHPASASHHAALPGRRRRDERRLRRERRGRREWRRACLRVCVPLYVLRALRVRRHVLWCWFCPELLASPGHHQCVYL